MLHPSTKTRHFFAAPLFSMCNGLPRHHPCGHQSVHWNFCIEAAVDLETGRETPCAAASFVASQPSKADCPLQNCWFKDVGGRWVCCVCGNGPNTMGWCTFSNPSWAINHNTNKWERVETCDHGCCENCTPARKSIRAENPSPAPEGFGYLTGEPAPDPAKKSRSRKKGHKSRSEKGGGATLPSGSGSG